MHLPARWGVLRVLLRVGKKHADVAALKTTSSSPCRWLVAVCLHPLNRQGFCCLSCCLGARLLVWRPLRSSLFLAGACRLCTPSIDAGCLFRLSSSFAAVFAYVFVLYTTVDASATLLHIFGEKGEITGNLHWHLGQWPVLFGSVPVLLPLPRPG